VSDQLSFFRPPGKTIAQGRAEILAGRENGIACPCCGRLQKIYKRPIHATMARALIEIYRQGGLERWVDVKKINRALGYLETVSATADFAKFAHWDFLIEKPNDDSTRRSSGLWMLNQRGGKFVRREIRVSAHAHIFLNELVGWDDKTTDIVESLGKRFDYLELMGS
jgi:hypothetical protein